MNTRVSSYALFERRVGRAHFDKVAERNSSERESTSHFRESANIETWKLLPSVWYGGPASRVAKSHVAPEDHITSTLFQHRPLLHVRFLDD